MIRNVILDWSGTLVDDLPPVIHATNAILRHYRVAELSRDEFRMRFRLPFMDFYAEILPGVEMAALESIFVKHFSQLHHTVTLLPGALEFLAHCEAAACRLFLLSTVKEAHFETQAQRLGVRGYFEHAYVDVMDKRLRIADILTERGLNPNETLYAGDMVHDVETAKVAHVLAVAVLTGFDPLGKLAASQPDIIAQDLGRLIRLIG